MNRNRWIISIIAILLLAGIIVGRVLPRSASPYAIASHPSGYDGKIVRVVGTVADLDDRVSRKGNAYHTFQVTSGKDSVTVFSFGPAHVSDGDRVRVTGKFQLERRVGYKTYYNEIDATKGSIERL